MALQTPDRVRRILDDLALSDRLEQMDSLSLIDLVRRLEKSFQIAIPITELMPERFESVDSIAGLVDELRPPRAPRNEKAQAETGVVMTDHDDTIISLKRGDSSRLPLMLIHPVSGTELPYLELARAMKGNRPVYAMRSPSLKDGGALDPPPKTVEETATSYARRLGRLGPGLLLAGWSYGAVVAYEVACRLHEQGRTVAALVMFDPPDPGGPIDILTAAVKRGVLSLAMKFSILAKIEPFRHIHEIDSSLVKFMIGLRPEMQSVEELTALARFAFPPTSPVPDKISVLPFEDAWKVVFAELQARATAEERERFALGSMSPEMTLRFAKTWVRNQAMLDTYRPKRVYSGRSSALICEEGRPAALRWNGQMARPLDIRPFPIKGKEGRRAHACMFDRENIQLFVGALERMLDDEERVWSASHQRA